MISVLGWLCAVLDLILIHVLPSPSPSAGHCHAGLQLSSSLLSSRHSFSLQSQVVNLLLLSLSLRGAQPRPTASSRRKFGAKNAKMIKCWVIALTWMVDNWAVRWRETSYLSLYTSHWPTLILPCKHYTIQALSVLFSPNRYIFFNTEHFVARMIADMTDVIGIVLQSGYQV